MNFSEWDEKITKKYHHFEIFIKRDHALKNYKSKCYANPDPDNDQCNLRNLYKNQQIYYGTNYRGCKTSQVVECQHHFSGPLDLLRDQDKIILSADESIVEVPVRDTPKQAHRDELYVIMCSDEVHPKCKRFIHFTVGFIIDIFMKLWLKPNFNLWRKNYVNNYAKHVYHLYEDKVSLSRLQKEADIVFISPPTFTNTLVHFFGNKVREFVATIREYIARHPYRQYCVDGNKKLIKRLRIFEGTSKYSVDASLNITVCGGTALIGNLKLYPKSKETHINISELLIEPIMRSLRICKIYKPLIYSLGIDHPDRDYGIPKILVPLIKQELQLMPSSESDGFVISPSGLEYNPDAVSAFVKNFFLLSVDCLP